MRKGYTQGYTNTTSPQLFQKLEKFQDPLTGKFNASTKKDAAATLSSLLLWSFTMMISVLLQRLVMSMGGRSGTVCARESAFLLRLLLYLYSLSGNNPPPTRTHRQNWENDLLLGNCTSLRPRPPTLADYTYFCVPGKLVITTWSVKNNWFTSFWRRERRRLQQPNW